MIKNFIKTEFNLNSTLEIYGSFASDMDIEGSDIDVTIVIEENNYDKGIYVENSLIMKKLVDFMQKSKLYENITPIYTASVPVIKICCDPQIILEGADLEKLEIMKNCEEYKNYKFDKEELNKYERMLQDREVILFLINF